MSKKKTNNTRKLLIVINNYSQKSDQHLFHVINLVREIAENGVEIFLVIERCDGEKPYIHENVHVYSLKHKKGIGRAIDLFFLANKIMRNGVDKAFVRITIPSARIIALCGKIHCCETYYWNSGGLNERPSDPHTSKESKRTIRRIKSVGRLIDHFITGPESMIEFYPKYCGVPKKKMMLLYNDVDLNRFCPLKEEEKRQLRKELSFQDNVVYVLFVHRFSPIRRSTYYIPYCISEYNDSNVVFILIGDGPEKKRVVDAVEKSGIKNTIFLGSMPNSEIQKYYQACDVFFNPSYCEGFPRVVIEAMACGLPIVSTDAGGTVDLFGPLQRQFVIDVDDRELLAKKLATMVDSAEMRESCIIENLKRVEKYSTKQVAKMYINAFWPIPQKTKYDN